MRFFYYKKRRDMGKKWDGKTLKKIHVDRINHVLAHRMHKYTYFFYTGKGPSTERIRYEIISDHQICSVCGRFRNQHWDRVWGNPGSCPEIAKIYKEAREAHGIKDEWKLAYCKTRYESRTLDKTFKRDEALSLAVESYIRMKIKVDEKEKP
jgi:hypothetical protein